MIVAGISIFLRGSVFVVLLLMLVLIGLAVVFYRYTIPQLPTRKRIILSSLRALSLLFLLLIFFEPVLRFIRHDEQQPRVAVLIDNSQSMTIKDAAGDRSASLRRYLNEQPFARFSSGTATSAFLFSSKLRTISSVSPDSVTFNGETTNLAEAFVELKDRLAKENIQAIVVLSDGNYTVGKNPLYDAEALGIPMYTVGIGDTVEQKDVLVEKVITNSVAYAETRLPVDVIIKSSGYKNENIEVVVSEGSAVLDRKMVMLQEGTHEYPVKLSIETKEEGVKKYTVSVSKLQGELTEKNNARSIFIKMLKSKLRVLILAGAPNTDVASVHQVLTEDVHFNVRALVQKNQNEFYEGSLSRPVLDSADCIVLIGFPSAATSNSVLQQLHDAIAQAKKPILFINGKMTDYAKLQTLEPFLPFLWSGVNQNEEFVFPSIPEKQKTNTLINLEGSVTADVWQQMPPVYKTQTTFRAKPESDVLAWVKVQNIVLNEPLVVTRSIAGQKAFALTGYGMWRWRLLAQGSVQTENFLALLMSNAVRWLTTKEDEKNVRIVPTKETFTTAEPVEFTAQVYDDQLRPVDRAEVTIQLQRGKETFQVALNAIGSGLYEGSTEGLGEGDYTFTGKAVADGKTCGEDRGRFSVGQMNVEFLETKMNKQLLEQIAFHTGGRYYDLASAGSIAADVSANTKFSSKDLVQTSELEIWNWQYLAAIIVLLLGIEWFLRKRSGML